MSSIATYNSNIAHANQQPTDTASQTLHHLIRVNHENYNIIHTGYRVNHMVHHLCVLKALGADSQRLEKAMEHGRRSLDRLKQPSVAITEENWKNHLGDTSTYPAYLEFFSHQLKSLGANELFLKYVPTLLSGAVGAVGHSLIHLGFAIEFNDSLVLVEALALASARYFPLDDIIDTYTYHSNSDTNIGFKQVIQEVANDKALDITFTNGLKFSSKLQLIMTKKDIVAKHFNKVVINEAHGVTSAHAIRVLFDKLPVAERVRMLRVEWLLLVIVYIAQGCPSVDKIDAVMQPYLHNYSWQKIIDEGIATDDQHVPKIVYSMKEAERLFGEQGGKWRPLRH
ncbi:hypothetical protein BDF19DRAFT_453987 [Syncephalis fuscata]|nr:hypothetical protein BDF19DRAFT_453987 [Syncephalis fuscata]